MATGSSVCGGGRWIFGFPPFLVDEVDGWGSAFPLPPLPAFPALLLLGGGEGLDVFFCWLVVWVLWLLTLTGTGVSVPTGQVSSVCTDTVAVCLRLLCIVEEFAVETTEFVSGHSLAAQKEQLSWRRETKCPVSFWAAALASRAFTLDSLAMKPSAHLCSWHIFDGCCSSLFRGQLLHSLHI